MPTTDTQHLWFDTALLADGWADAVRVSIRGGKIVELASDVAPAATDARHGVAFAGLGNVHSHAFQRAMAGLTETGGVAADNFWSWRECMYHFVDTLDPDAIEAIAAFAYAEMLEAGFTHVGEFHYLHHDTDGKPYGAISELAGRIVAAAATTGIGLTLLPVFYAHAGFGGLAPAPLQRRFICNIDQYGRLLEECRSLLGALERPQLGVAPHSLRAVTPSELAAVIELLPGHPVHIHAAEQIKEVRDCLAWSGQRPVEWLLERAPLDSRWCLIHAVHMHHAETERLAATGAVVGACPITEANLGDGIAPIAALVVAGGRFGIGTDSNVQIGAAGELRQLEYAQRLERRERNVLVQHSGERSSGRRSYEAALQGGARALGYEGQLLAVGSNADIVSLYADHPSLIARRGDALLDSWIFTGSERLIECVWRSGRKLVADGRHIERNSITARYRNVLQRLRK
jgi:formiminoglutamate deiminase